MSLPHDDDDHPTDERPAGSGDAEDHAGRYGFLIQRAVAFVRAQGGAVHEDALIAYVFGGGTATLWQPFLRQVLTKESGLVLRADRTWALPASSSSAQPGVLGEFVAIDVETTGLRPLQQRIIEIAAIRFRDGVEVERFETFCNPEKRIPKYIADLTGITDEHVAEAPRFAACAEALERFLDAATIVGHNVGFDLGFLNAELKRLGRPPLVNDRIDVMALAMKLLPALRRPSLDKVALAVGLNPRHIHRAGIDAQLAAEVALRLAERARDAGLGSSDQLKTLSAASERRPKDGVGRGRAVLDRSLLADIPKRPGVYIMRDASDRVIYVGKAKNLRDRVGSYYSQPLGYTRKMDGLLESLVRIDVEVTGCELEALLLESQLIKRYQPRYNSALRSFEQYPFIRVDVANPWPRITLARSRKDDGARYFGPFRNKGAARVAVDLINANYPLRTCPRSFKDSRSYGAPCIQLDLGRCLGPCVGRADRDTYMALVRQVIRFLDGDDEVLFERIWQGLEAAAQRLDFERARRLRNDLQQLRLVVSSQSAIRRATERHTLVLVLPSAAPNAAEVLLVVRGRIWARVRSHRDEGPSALAGCLERSWLRMAASGVAPIDHEAVDEANILNRWLFKNANHPAILPIKDSAELDWMNLAVRAHSLTDEELAADARNMDDEEIGDHGEGNPWPIDCAPIAITSQAPHDHFKLLPIPHPDHDVDAGR